MPTDALLAVLLGAVLHAGWNTAIKSGTDTRRDTVLVAGGAAVIAALFLPWLGVPTAASLPCLVASACLQLLYFRLVAAAYRCGDMSLAYPLMRGTPPLLIAACSGFLLDEQLSASAWAGTSLVCAGVLTLALSGRPANVQTANAHTANGCPTDGPKPRLVAVLGVPLANAAVIAAYTVIDGVGVRLSGNPPSYTLWVFLLAGIPVVLGGGPGLAVYARTRWPVAVVGGFCVVASYGLALWAMTRAPVATVAALRESSILFALLFAALILRERIGWWRAASGAAIALGAAALRL
ncbi:EamA family transporter [Azospirillum griseum]|uniref:EamA family transporter n=2 Tax=Azospirillum griseum TaxID=2496639 RepID=A0A431VBQ0_9PROT|nr:EamA family transporter [Azospirillum griseum]